MNTTSHDVWTDMRVKGGEGAVSLSYLVLLLVPLLITVGNVFVVLIVCVDAKLRRTITNKFIASLAVSDLLMGVIVTPLAIYINVHNNVWTLPHIWCRVYLSTTVFATTASIVHLVAISVDRYFAIVFPSEYQRHALRTKASSYIIGVWLMSLAVCLPSFMETEWIEHEFCWLEDPQYLILSSLLTFILPAICVVYIYIKIFRKLRAHMGLLAAVRGSWRRQRTPRYALDQLPQVVVEEVRSRRGSHNVPDVVGRDRSPSSPDTACRGDRSGEQHVLVRERSPTIAAESISHKDLTRRQAVLRAGRGCASTSEVNVDECHPSTSEVTKDDCNAVKHAARHALVKHSDSMPQNYSTASAAIQHLTVPSGGSTPANTTTSKAGNGGMVRACVTSALVNNNQLTSYSCGSSGRSSLTGSSLSSGSCGDDTGSMYRRDSRFSCISTLTDNSEEMGNRRNSALSMISESFVATAPMLSSAAGKPITAFDERRNTRWKLRRIATQVTKAIRRKRKESQVIRKESRATRIVAAILFVFIACWLPYFILSIYRGVCLGVRGCTMSYAMHTNAYIVTSWFGYIHSAFNPLIYTVFNKNFQRTLKLMLTGRLRHNHRHARRSTVFYTEGEDDKITTIDDTSSKRRSSSCQARIEQQH